VPSVYVPQMGDEVVYLRTGHQRFLDSQNDKRPPPWEYLTVSAYCLWIYGHFLILQYRPLYTDELTLSEVCQL